MHQDFESKRFQIKSQNDLNLHWPLSSEWDVFWESDVGAGSGGLWLDGRWLAALAVNIVLKSVCWARNGPEI